MCHNLLAYQEVSLSKLTEMDQRLLNSVSSRVIARDMVQEY